MVLVSGYMVTLNCINEIQASELCSIVTTPIVKSFLDILKEPLVATDDCTMS